MVVRASNIMDGRQPTAFQNRVLALPEDINLLLDGGRGGGKGLANTEFVLTNTGWKKVDSVTLDDKLVTPKGEYTRILAIWPQPEGPVYRVMFSDGAWLDVDAPHKWVCRCTTSEKWTVVATYELVELVEQSNWCIPNVTLPAPGQSYEGAKFGGVREIASIVRIADGPTTCFTIEDADSQFVCQGFVVTHNSECVKFAMIKHAVKYGAAAKILYVRETWGAIGQFEDELSLLILSLYGKKVKHNQTEHTFTWPSGATIYLNQLADEKDYVKFQGKSFTLLVIDEYGAMSTTKYCWLLVSNMRAAVGVPLRVILLANPGGFQHGHIHKDFISQSVGWKPFDRKGEWWVHCPSTWRDNPTINQADYLRKLREACGNDEELFKAWDTGDWNIARGAYFSSTLDEKIHKLSGVPFESGKPRIISAECPYVITREWCPYITHDWGSSVPSATYIMVESPGVPGFMKGSLIVVDELATYDPSDTQWNTGLEWPPSKLADSIVNDLCKPWGVDPMGVGDDSKGIEDSLLKKFREYGLYLTKPHKERISGWQEMSNLFMGAKTGERPGLWVTDRCVYFWNTVPFLQRDPKRPEDILTKGPDHAGDACFVAGTMVRSPMGEVRIENLKIGELVETRDGARQVKAVGIRRAKTYKVQFSNLSSLTGTYEHPVMTNTGWVPLGELQLGQEVVTWQNQKLLNLTESFLEDTQSLTGLNSGTTILQTALFGQKVSEDFTKKSGNIITEQFPQDITYTIKTKTLSTMMPQICTAFHPENIYQDICESQTGQNNRRKYSKILQGRPHPNGMDLSKVVSGIARWLLTLGLFVKLWWLYARMCLVEKSMSHISPVNSAATSANQQNAERLELTMFGTSVNGAQPISNVISMKKYDVVRVVAVPKLVGTRNVCNLEVQDQPEYFANGVLVHNCRYGVLYRTRGAKSGSIEGDC